MVGLPTSAVIDAGHDGAGGTGREYSPEWTGLESDAASAADDDDVSEDIPQELIHARNENVM